jgi:hypothetical protein
MHGVDGYCRLVGVECWSRGLLSEAGVNWLVSMAALEGECRLLGLDGCCPWLVSRAAVGGWSRFFGSPWLQAMGEQYIAQY